MFKNFFKKIQILSVVVSLFTMVISPVAMGAQAERLSKNNIQSAFEKLGLNKSITIGDFYKKNKDLFPEGLQKQIEPFADQFKNQQMPSFEVVEVKNSKGEVTSAIRLTGESQLYNIQMFGEENKYARFENTDLTEQEILNFNLMIEKLYYREPRLRKQVGGSDKARTVESLTPIEYQTFKRGKYGIPEISKEVWKTFTIEEKAQYIYNMRKLWTDSLQVIEAQEKFKNSSSSQKTKTSYFKLLIDSVLEKAVADAPVWVKQGGLKDDVGSDTCVVAGYISKYNKKRVCDTQNIKQTYDFTENSIAKKAFEDCPSDQGQIACNPYIYGLNSAGKGICIKVEGRNSEFQKATHSAGPCERESKLGSKDISFLKNSNKKKDRYSEDNLKPGINLEEEYKKQFESEKVYQDNIERFLKNSVKDSKGQVVNFDEALEDHVIGQLKNLREVFNEQINKAKKACMSAAKNEQYDQNFGPACDQLQRRYLFVAEFLAKKPGCKDNAKFDSQDLQCSCNGGLKVNPGVACTAPNPQPADPIVQPQPPVADKPVVSDTKCPIKCDAPGVCEKVTTANNPVDDKWICTGTPNSKKASDKDSGGGFWSGLWSFAKKAAPWVGGALGLYLTYKLLAPKKPKLNAAADACANGVASACIKQCPTGQALLSSGLCGCQGCPPGSSITNVSNCACSLTTVNTTNLITCSDNITQVTNSADCPEVANILCPNGTYVTNILNCPSSSSSKTSTQNTGK